MNESCHIWMSHVTYIYTKAAYEAYGASLAITPVLPAASLHLEPPEPGSYVRHDSFICVTWLIRMCTPWTSRAWCVWVCLTRLFFRMCAMTHLYVYREKCHTCTWGKMSHNTYEGETFHMYTKKNVTQHIRGRNVTHVYKGKCYTTHTKEKCLTCVYKEKCHTTHTEEKHLTCTQRKMLGEKCYTGLFFRISSFLYGSFAKETCNFKKITNTKKNVTQHIRRRNVTHVYKGNGPTTHKNMKCQKMKCLTRVYKEKCHTTHTEEKCKRGWW